MGMNMSRQLYSIYLDAGCPSGDGYSCPIFVVRQLLEEKDMIERIILLNALVPVSDKPAIVASIPTTIENIKELVRRAQKIESYIGHEATAKLLTQLFGVEIPVSRAMYVPNHRDLAVVVRLKKRLERPEDVKNVKLEDIEFLLVKYYTNVDVVTRDW